MIARQSPRLPQTSGTLDPVNRLGSLLRGTALTLVLAVIAAPGGADTVVLANGNSYEGVVAEIGEQRVTVRLAFGTIVLPAEQVDRVDKSVSPLEVYLERREELEGRDVQDASSWFALAEWARRHGLPQAARAAALEAAGLEPGLPGLGDILEPAGYRFDEELGRWLELDEYMARRGLVRSGDGWITREEQRRRAAERQEAVRALLQTSRERQRQSQPPVSGPLVVVSVNQPQPVVSTVPFWGVWQHPRFFHHASKPRHTVEPGDRADPRERRRISSPPTTRSHRSSYRSLVHRQPGSFLPLDRRATSTSDH